MGHTRNDAIIATSWDTDRLIAQAETFRAWLLDHHPDFAPLLVGPIHSAINSYVTYFLAPDGSKEGWEDSDIGDEVRTHFANAFDGYIDVVAVRYGGDYARENRAMVMTLRGPDDWDEDVSSRP